MTREDLDLLAEIARERAGLNLTGAASSFAESRLAVVARREGAPSIAALVERLRVGREPALIAQVVEALADDDTAFFRDRQTFERLRTEVIPALAERRPGGPVRIWSAGCSTGQEAYSLAMLAYEMGSLPGGAAVRIVASDINERALQKAKSGLYSHFEVQRGLPIRTLLAHFEKADDHWRISPALRQSVRWGRVNLMDDLSRFGPFDVILCRNVLSTLHPRAAQQVLGGLEGALAPDGWLITGAAEAVTAPAAFTGQGGLLLRNPAYERDAA
ncbi:protein-glutamate O-methyltransferase CheR [soil metagenome]